MTGSILGNYALCGAILTAGMSLLAAVAGLRRRAWWLRLSRAMLYVLAGLLSLASLALLAAILDNRFENLYVAGHSERNLPLGYKIAAFWAGQEGSLLLWAWLLAGLSALAARLRRTDPPGEQGPSLALLALVNAFFAVLLLYAANPFGLSESAPADGRGLNPMLQDPAMILHPPLLFVGYAGFTIPFAYALGAVLAGRFDEQWVPRMRRWVLGSWVFLTAGIVLGAVWAYWELGWGGYWAWDPVENASLLPWFSSTGLLHVLLVQQRRRMMRGWASVLAVLTFLLCLFGTYLTRSGVIQSQHTFPRSPIGQFFLVFLGAALVLSGCILLWRRRSLRPERPLERLLSREGALLAAAVLLLVMLVVTLVGTIFPLLSGPFLAAPMSLGEEFYNSVVVPMGLALVALIGVGVLLAPAKAGKDRRTPRRRLVLPILVAHLGGGAAALLGGGNRWAIAAAAVAALALTGVLMDLAGLRLRTLPALRASLRRCGAHAAHLGMVLVMAGVAGSSLYGTSHDWQMQPGQSQALGRYRLTLASIDQVRRENFTAVEARVDLANDRGPIAEMRPQRRFYDKSSQPNHEVALRTGLFEDVYVVLAGWRDRGAVVTLQVYHNPLVSWIWIGGALLAAGALLAMLVNPARREPTDPPGAPEPQARPVEPTT